MVKAPGGIDHDLGRGGPSISRLTAYSNSAIAQALKQAGAQE